jgi:hypothetical protein
MTRTLAPLAGVLVLGITVPATATPPSLYAHPTHQSPVRAAPDDLILLAGAGLSTTDLVVYRRLTDTTAPLVAPALIPIISTADLGVAPVVSETNVPQTLTVRLPPVTTPGRSYALWVRGSDGSWSNGVRVNDARPLWVSPSYLFYSTSLAGLPRQLNVVGRNLDRMIPTRPTRVRLTGPATYVLDAQDDGDPATTLEEYVARVNLPAGMPTGAYQVQVSRDAGQSWVSSPQAFYIRPNPARVPILRLVNYGCAPNDGLDDTPCFIAAIAAAEAQGGGRIDLGAGSWDLAPSAATWSNLVALYPTLVSSTYGPVVPVNVHLHGVGAGLTTVTKAADWPGYAVFTLMGLNTIDGVTWRDLRSYLPSDWTGGFFQIGPPAHLMPEGSGPISNITITANVFDRPFSAIFDGGLPMRSLHITFNEISAYSVGLSLGGNQYAVQHKFRVDESVVKFNHFAPGDYLDVCGHQGTIASSLGASHRLDFSENELDGHDTTHLADPTHPGWRAGSFFHMQGSHDSVLVARNVLTCTGDKAGDGEAIVFDANLDTLGFPNPPLASGAGADWVSSPIPLSAVHTGNGIPVPPSYFAEHWVKIANGPGLGQARRIASITSAGGGVTLHVTPPWDVPPVAGQSVLTVSRQAWQVHTVDNVIDQRGCAGVNGNGYKKAGVLSYYGNTADSSLSGNIQYASGGILLPAGFNSIHAPEQGYRYFQQLQYFNEVRYNRVLDEPDYDSGCSASGIQLPFGAASGTPAQPTANPSPVVAAYGVQVLHNHVEHADGLRGGALTMPPTWWVTPSSRLWLNTLIHHNAFVDLPATPVSVSTLDGCIGPVACEDPPRGICVNLLDPAIHSAVLYGNTCPAGATPLVDLGTATTP